MRIVLWIFIICLLGTNAVLAQDEQVAVNLQNISPADTLRKDTTSKVEDAPLDIAQNRGIFILSPDKQMEMRIIGSIRMLIVFDEMNFSNKNFFRTYDIPTGVNNDPLPNYYNGLDQTRMGFEVTRKTSAGNLFARIETDFAGVNGFRIRHAYGQYKNFLVGQTWSLFSQVAALPATADFSGPSGSVRSRTPQLRYSLPKPIHGMNISLGLEYLIPDLSIPDSLTIQTFQLIPNITGKADKNFQWGYLQVSGIIPMLSARTDSNKLIVRPGWGLASSSYGNITSNSKWHIQIAGGQAISSFLKDLNDNGLDVILDQDENPHVPFSWGGYLGYEYLWYEGLSSNVIYSIVQTEEFEFNPDNAFRRGTTWRANTFWDFIEGAKLGAEIIYGRRVDHNHVKGNAVRFNLLFYYDF
ncbi:hypothetical protein IFO69_00665 [Echinicola sp. CAU 1574]|uniref:Porin n=1 Tax=Echinicola arenosa TaxID=2774144 RepID=A0ABR9AG39_9BACT|nr:DcaP family trimeric outer membrane transporter [Echinicola arenosa]MBD8487247.1 hypothetical protein [Echinicola arenosa]